MELFYQTKHSGMRKSGSKRKQSYIYNLHLSGHGLNMDHNGTYDQLHILLRYNSLPCGT